MIPPMLSALYLEEELFLYLLVSEQGLSSILLKADERVHQLISYANHVLYREVERYIRLEKFSLGVIITARCLRLYFQAHPMIVLTNMLLRSIFSKPDKDDEVRDRVECVWSPIPTENR